MSLDLANDVRIYLNTFYFVYEIQGIVYCLLFLLNSYVFCCKLLASLVSVMAVIYLICFWSWGILWSCSQCSHLLGKQLHS